MTDMISKNLKEQVSAQVMYDVINGTLTVDSVISEKKLAEQMNVSKAPVREALVELCARGVLQSLPRKGYMLTRYTERSIGEILKYRAVLECGSLAGCYDRITPTQMRRLESVVESEYLFISQNHPRDFWNNTFNFHLTLMSFSDNEYMYKCLNEALGACMRGYQQIYLDALKNPLPVPPRYHLEIVDCLKRGDGAMAVEKLRADIMSINAQ